jgi:spermidine synthase
VPLTYYDRVGPVGDVFGLTFSGVQPQRRVAVVGLGVGALACYGRSGEQWTFYEIDPVVVSIARDPRLFTFLRDCSPAVGVVVGDARLSLVKAAASQYDIIVIDAFSSDAIPVHLLTREALQLYIRVTAPHGLFVFHISNRHLDLEPVVAQLAMDAGLAAKVRRDVGAPPSRSGPGRYASHWVVMARSMDDLGAIATDRQWQSLRRRARVHVWTDDFSNIMTVFRWEWGN